MKKLSITLIGAAYLLAQAAFAQDVQPGDVHPSVADILPMFNAACVSTLPDFAATEQMLESSGYFQRAETGTFYHNNFNLSFKVHDNEGQLVCSLVFFNNTDIPAISTELINAMRIAADNNAMPFPNAKFDVRSAKGDSLGFHRLAIFMNQNQ